MSDSVENAVTDKIRVLLVDDEQAQMELIKLNLEDSDPSLAIYTISTPREALTILREESIECVVSDYQLPGMDGIQLCREIRAFSSIPFIIYTGRGSEEVASAAFSAGVDDYIRKEKELAHYKVLANGIRHAVERRHTEKARVRAVEELRSSQEELRSANEELSAMEEELRSSNEQLTVYSAQLEEMVEERTREIRKAEERLRQSSLYARSLIEASVDPLVTISAEGKITDVNEATVQVTGVSREHLIGSDFFGYFTEPEKARAGYMQVFREGRVRDYPLSIRHASGEVRDVLYNAALYTNEAAEVQGVFAAARDVTERNRLEAQHRLDEKRIRHSEQMEAVSRMGATVAHDLRGPFGVIVQSVNVAKQDPSRTQRMLQLIEDSAVRSLSMIANWRSSTREINLQPRETNLSDLVGNVVEGANIPGIIKVTTELGNLEAVRLDPDVMHRVIDNIVTNAVEAMPDGGRLTIKGVRGSDYVSLSISDTGLGISEENRGKIFSPLFTTKSGGMGLGLNFCRRAVEAHGGSIEFESEVRKGTTFTIKLPIK